MDLKLRSAYTALKDIFFGMDATIGYRDPPGHLPAPHQAILRDCESPFTSTPQTAGDFQVCVAPETPLLMVVGRPATGERPLV